MGRDEVSAASLTGHQDALLLDTHALVWLMFGEKRLGSRAKDEIAQAADADNLLVSAITPWEIALLVSKKRIDLQRDPLEWITAALSLPGIRLAPLEPEIAVASTRLPFEMHPDPADRILVATARQLGATLVTADKSLLVLAKKRNFKALNAAA
jgi:PIN domain nuclease of toxin-antitoxin system